MTAIQATASVKADRFPDRPIRIGPDRRIMFSEAFPKLAAKAPKTRLGQTALKLGAETAVSVISISAVSSYVNAIGNAALPTLTFQGTPPDGLTNQELQDAYDLFLGQYQYVKNQAALWNKDGPDQEPAVLTQLTSVMANITEINEQVQSAIVQLANLVPGSQSYDEILEDVTTEIGALNPPVGELISAMSTLGSELASGTEALVADATTGTLVRLINVYQEEITSLQESIRKARVKIDADESAVETGRLEAREAVTLGLIGLANIWNPVGWVMIGAGTIGTAISTIDVATLQGRIADLHSEIKQNRAWQDSDATAAASVATLAHQAAGFASLNTAAQQELTTLEVLFQTLGDDLAEAIADLNGGALSGGLAEWNDIIQAAAFLSDLSVYTWPGFPALSNPTVFSATGRQVYVVNQAGDIYTFTEGDTGWTKLPGTTFSAAAAHAFVVGIAGAPVVNAPNAGPSPDPTFFAQLYEVKKQSWAVISTFPVAAVATDGLIIACIRQDEDRGVYGYDRTHETWTAFPPLPDGDVADQLAVAEEAVFALSNLSQSIYLHVSGNWIPVSDQKFARISANGSVLSAIGTDGTVYSFTYGVGMTGKQQMGSSGIMAAPLTDGSQFVVTSDLTLQWLRPNMAPINMQDNAVSCFAGDSDQVYYTDNLGAIWRLDDLGSNTWTQLPPLP